MIESQIKFQDCMPEIHLQDYMPVIFRRRWVIITFFTMLVAVVSIGSLKQAPIYEAVATIMIEQKSPSVVSFKEVEDGLGANKGGIIGGEVENLGFLWMVEFFDKLKKLLIVELLMVKLEEGRNHILKNRVWG